MTYIDGFLIPVPLAKKDEYLRMARVAAKVFTDHGAVHISENWGEDLMKGHTTDFYMAVKAEEGENVVFSWITWPSKEARDSGNKAAMADPRFAEFEGNDTFNGKRMIYSGFENMLDVRA